METSETIGGTCRATEELVGPMGNLHYNRVTCVTTGKFAIPPVNLWDHREVVGLLGDLRDHQGNCGTTGELALQVRPGNLRYHRGTCNKLRVHWGTCGTTDKPCQ